MTNTDLLKQKIKISSMTIQSLAEKLKITRAGLYKKINGLTEFKASEIALLSDILNLTNKEKENIFFAVK